MLKVANKALDAGEAAMSAPTRRANASVQTPVRDHPMPSTRVEGTENAELPQLSTRSARYSGCALSQADARRMESSLFLLMNL
jgi:hypothetical protein